MRPPKSPILRVVGVYDADGSLRGEVACLLRRALTGEHCALCDITHGALRKRPTWERYASGFSSRHGVDIHLAHLDDAPRSILDHEEFRAPALYLERADGTVEPLLTAEELESCGRSPERLFALLEIEWEKRR